jgi:hypothetical protein
MKIKNPYHFEEIIKKGYSLDQLYLLSLIKSEIDISEMINSSARISAIFSSLIRKGLVSDSTSKLTIIGTELLNYIESEEQVKFIKTKPKDEDFNEFWNSYPGTDKFEYKGRKFNGSRGLRVNSEKCKTYFNNILLEGKYTARQIIDAMKYDVQMRKEASVKKGTNQLTFMQSSTTYLYNKSFSPFIELINEGVEIEQTPKSGTDI